MKKEKVFKVLAELSDSLFVRDQEDLSDKVEGIIKVVAQHLPDEGIVEEVSDEPISLEKNPMDDMTDEELEDFANSLSEHQAQILLSVLISKMDVSEEE